MKAKSINQSHTIVNDYKYYIMSPHSPLIVIVVVVSLDKRK